MIGKRSGHGALLEADRSTILFCRKNRSDLLVLDAQDVVAGRRTRNAKPPGARGVPREPAAALTARRSRVRGMLRIRANLGQV